VISTPDPDSDYQLLRKSLREPRGDVDRLVNEAQEHLDSLWVIGAGHFSDDELRQLGPYLAREATYREDAVFHVLNSRRNDAPEYLRRFITVKKKHLLLYGLGSQAGKISLESVQKEYTAKAQELLQPLVERDEFEDSFLASDMQRRVLRALFYIASEPSESTKRLLARLHRQADDSGKLDPEELIARFYNFVYAQHDKHLKDNPNHLETEETMIKLLEEGRLQRLKSLGQTVLVAGLGVITAEEYKDKE